MAQTYLVPYCHDDGQLDAVVWRTLPHMIGVSGGSVESVTSLVHGLRMNGLEIDGANCAGWTADILAREIAAQDGRVTEVTMRQRLFRLDELIIPTLAPGAMVDATWDDVDLVERWAHRFCIDCGVAEPGSEPQKGASVLERGGLRLWVVDDQPVAMAGSMRQSPRGASISWVYTPDAHRGHGYASSLVATLSQHYLDNGKDFCSLFTDQANPTSNKIYQALGYRPITDFHRIRFRSAG